MPELTSLDIGSRRIYNSNNVIVLKLTAFGREAVRFPYDIKNDDLIKAIY